MRLFPEIMRRISIVIFCSVCVLASGCSELQVQPDRNIAGNDDWKYDESLPVPILFSTPEVGIESKAMVEGDVMKSLDIGIFALANEYTRNQQGDISCSPAWDASNDGGTLKYDEGVLMFNTKVTTGSDGSISFNPARYYPIDQTRSYAFYAYYPHHTAYFDEADQCFRADFTIGQDDILWAESHATPITGDDSEPVFGYNASYIRAGGETPALHFNHLLTALKFSADFKATDFKITEFTLAGIRSDGEESIEGLPLKVALNIEGSAASSGDIESGTFKVKERGVIHAFNDDGGWALDGSQTDNEIGTFLILPVSAGETLYIELTVLANDGYTYRSGEIPINDGFAFEAGKYYEFNVTVNGKQDISVIPSTLSGWENGFGN